MSHKYWKYLINNFSVSADNLSRTSYKFILSNVNIDYLRHNYIDCGIWASPAICVLISVEEFDIPEVLTMLFRNTFTFPSVVLQASN